MYVNKLIIVVLIVTLFLSACQMPQEPTDAESSHYFSVTVTTDDGQATAEGGMVTTVYEVDLSNGETKEKWSFVRTAQYPLAAYSQYDNCVYYTQKVDSDEGKGDQLFCKNLLTGDVVALTEDLFGVNYIIPLDAERIAYVAAKKQSHLLGLYVYDKSTSETVKADLPEDMSIQRVSYNAVTGKLIGSGRFEKEERAAADLSNQGEGQKFIPPDHYIYDFTDVNDVKLLYKTERMSVERLASDSNNQLLFTLSDTDRGWNPSFETFSYDIEDKTHTPIENLDAQMYISEFLFCKEDILYFIGVDERNTTNNSRGIYAYNLSTKETHLVFTSKDGWINNFILL